MQVVAIRAGTLSLLDGALEKQISLFFLLSFEKSIPMADMADKPLMVITDVKDLQFVILLN